MTEVPVSLKRRILIFRNELLPSSETFVRAQANALRRFEPYFAGVHASPHPLQLSPPPILLDSADGFAGKFRRRIFWRTALEQGFTERVLRVHPSLIHAHFALDGAAVLPVAKSLRVPLIVTLHGYDVTSSDTALSASPEGRCYLRRRPRLWENTSVFLCISEFIRERAMGLGFPREKLRVHYTGTDLSLFAESIASRDCNLIVFVGRLTEKKGCIYLLDAMEIVRRDHPAARLVCIGDGPLRTALEVKAAVSGMPCEFLGSQPPEVVKDYLARARICCVPSVEAASGDSEGLGMVFIEAQAMGTPVVSFRHGGIPEAVLEGQTGLLAAEKDPLALANYLLALLQDDAQWRHLSENGKLWVRKAFDLGSQTQELEGIYEEVLRCN